MEAAEAHGPHPTASTPDAIALFKENISYQVKAGFFSWGSSRSNSRHFFPSTHQERKNAILKNHNFSTALLCRLQGDAVGGHQVAAPRESQDLASRGGIPSWLTRTYHFRPVVLSVPRSQWDCDGHASKHQQHYYSQCPFDPRQRNWQGATPAAALHERHACRSSYTVFKIRHQQWILVPHCPGSR